jgi:hypothetical protein
MHGFDPLDWLHQWDDFEMMMYARADADDEPGIHMQVSRGLMRDGAQEWEIIYDRKIADIELEVAEPVGSDAWEEKVLRHHLQENPKVVVDEKEYLNRFLATNTDTTGKA